MGAMRYLLDTHTLLFAQADPARLSRRSKRIIEDRSTRLLVSAASAWEVATKHRLGRLPTAASLIARWSDQLKEMDAHELEITSAHALLAGSFAVDHRDPFDRLLAAQAVIENVTLLTDDPALRAFPVTTAW